MSTQGRDKLKVKLTQVCSSFKAIQKGYENKAQGKWWGFLVLFCFFSVIPVCGCLLGFGGIAYIYSVSGSIDAKASICKYGGVCVAEDRGFPCMCRSLVGLSQSVNEYSVDVSTNLQTLLGATSVFV